MQRPIDVVLDFVKAGQTILAIYGSPDGPTDCKACYDMMVKLFEDPKLLAAQMSLQPDHALVILEREPGVGISVLSLPQV